MRGILGLSLILAGGFLAYWVVVRGGVPLGASATTTDTILGGVANAGTMIANANQAPSAAAIQQAITGSGAGGGKVVTH